MLNYAEAGQATNFYVDASSDSFVMTTSRSWKAGEQVYINYGSFNSLRSNDDLLHQYGFVLEPNPFCTVKVSLRLGGQPPTSFRSRCVCPQN
jgi:hypothetical protein